MTRVVAAIGGSGGVGASTFAAALAHAAGRSVLVDLDGLGGGVDVALGIETRPGARWSGVRLGGGRLAQHQLLDGLPAWGAVAVLAADVLRIAADDVTQVLQAATDGPDVDGVILDVPRASWADHGAALARCDLVVVVVRPDPVGLVAARCVAEGLHGAPLGVVVRRGDLAAGDAAALVGAPLLGVLPPVGVGPVTLATGRVPRPWRRVAAGVLAGLVGLVDEAADA